MPLGRLNWCIWCDEVAVEIENLDAVVVAVADQKAIGGVDGERMRLVELARAGAQLAPFLDELAGLVEFDDAIVAGTMAFSDEDIAIGGR